MDKMSFDEEWVAIRPETTARWSLIGDFDLNRVDKSDGKFDKIVTMLQVKYGRTRQQARDEVGKFWLEYMVRNKDNPRVASLVKTKTRRKTNGSSRRKEKSQAPLQGNANPQP